MCDNCDKKKTNKNGNLNDDSIKGVDPITGLGALTAILKPYFSYRVLKPNWINKAFYTYQYFQQLSATSVRFHVLYYSFTRVNKKNTRTYEGRTYFDQTLSTSKINSVLTQISNGNYSSAIPNILDFNNLNIKTITDIVNKKSPKAKATTEDIVSVQQSSYPGATSSCGYYCQSNSECGGGCTACLVSAGIPVCS